jgi:hypothetical protein
MWDPKRRIPQRLLFEAEEQAQLRLDHLWGCYERLEAAAWAVAEATPFTPGMTEAVIRLRGLLELTEAHRRQGHRP